MPITDHTELRVYQHAFELAIQVNQLTALFPSQERNRLTDQIIRSSRSPCACIAEAWRKRRYPLLFVHKLTYAESEAAETRVWLEFAQHLGYLKPGTFQVMDNGYRQLLGELVRTRGSAGRWANVDRKQSDGQ